jgi:4-cresol dehydrogenase (hydroxylating)
MLADGTTIETGAARFPGASTASVNRWGVGPSLDGLFSQSNLGIVTRMSIWLMPKPDLFEAFFFRGTDPNGLPAVIDSLQRLRLKDVLRSSMHIVNDYKVLGGLRQYPWAETNETTPLTPELMASFRADLTVGYWNVSGGLYGSKAQVTEAKQLLRQEFAGQGGKLQFLTDKKLQMAVRFAKPFKMITGLDIRRTAKLVRPLMGLMRGEPMELDFAMSSAYWRKRRPPPPNPDPDRDGCGLLWFAPTAPADGAQVERLAKMTVDLMLKHGFEPMISLTMLTSRIVYSVLAITYDRSVPGEDEKAMVCYRELEETCQKEGYYPYRLGIQSQGNEQLNNGSYSALLEQLKNAVDPNGILAPGRYGTAASPATK